MLKTGIKTGMCSGGFNTGVNPEEIALVTAAGLVAVDGSGNVQVASPSSIPVNDFTVEMWTVWDGIAVESGQLGVWNSPGQFSWFFSTDSLGRPQLRYSFNGSTSQGPVAAPIGNLVAGVATHIAFTVSGGTVQFYMHGKKLGAPQALSAATDLYGSSTAPLDWGRDTNNSVTLTGDVGPTRIWNRVLQPMEMLKNYHLDTVDLSASLKADLVSSWNMGSTLVDSIGSNNATLTGTATQTSAALTYPSPYAFTWSTTQTDWRDLLGFTLAHGWVFDGGLPFTDMAGSDDFDVDNGLDDAIAWGGRLGGNSVGTDVLSAGDIATTNTGVFSPGTGNWSLFMSFNNGVADATNTNRSVLTSNGTGSGIRLIVRNNTSVEYLNPTAENSSATTRSPQINSVIGDNKNINMLFSRTSSTTIECWAAVEGSSTVYYDSVAIGAGEDFSEGVNPLVIGGAAPGNMLGGSRVKAMLYAAEAGSADIFDLYHDTVRTSIVPA